MNARFLASRCAAALMFFSGAICSLAQNPGTGSYPFSRLDSFGFDSINPGNLNVHFAIPVVNKPGRGLPFQYTLEFDGLVWSPTSAGGVSAWTPDASFGLHGYLLNDGYKGYLSYSDVSHKCYDDPDNPGYWEWLETISYFVYHDEYGVDHPFNYSDNQCNQAKYGNGITGDGSTSDGSGFKLNVNTYAVLSTSGLQMAIPTYVNGSPYALNATIEDSNGNLVTNNQNGTFTDTMNYTPLTISGVGSPSSPRVFTYSTQGGGTTQVTIYYNATPVSTAFNCYGVSEFGSQTINLPTSISLPDTSAYQFGYDSAGRMTSVTLPTGGTIYYTYSGGVNCADGSAMQLTRHTSVSNDGTTQYARSNVSSTHSHTEITGPHQDQTEIDFVYSAGTPYETTRSVYSGSSSGGNLLAKADTCYNGYVPPNCTTQPMSLPVNQASIYRAIYWNGGSVENGSDTYYNGYGLATDLKEYDYGSGARGSLLRETTYGYALLGGYLTDKIASVQQYNGNHSLSSQTAYGYDESQPTGTNNLPQHISVSGPRGNLTSLHSWVNSSTPIDTHFTVDDAGQTLTTYGTNPGTTTFAYDSTTDTLLTSVTPLAPNGVSLATSYTFDLYTGLLANFTDPNTQKKTYHYDNLLRQTEVDDTSNNVLMTVGYTPTRVSNYAYQDSSAYTDTETLFDTLGRQSRVAVGTGQGSDNWYKTDVCVNQSSLTSFRSYRYQGSSIGSAPICSGAGDTVTYDALGRVTGITHGDGSGTAVSYQYGGRASQMTDEKGVSRITQVDGLGRITSVCEISSNGSMPGSGNPVDCHLDLSGTGFLTTYAYDLANQKVTVTQGVQTRVFQTDWIGRPILTQEPERGQTTYGYSYNSTGLAVTRTRPAANQTNPSVPTTTTTQYDALSRVISISYSDSTPTKTFKYDISNPWGASVQNPKGRMVLQGISNAQSIYSYDAMGRVLWSGQCTPSSCATNNFLLSYTYDQLGNLKSATDGFGVTTSYTYTQANEVQTITSSASDAQHPANLVSVVQNGPFGPLTWQLGNGLTGVRTYDTMGRTSGGWVCRGSSQPTCTGGTQLYGFATGWLGAYLTGLCDTALNQCNTYGYDEFGRLNSLNSGSYSWVYDRWGNRTLQSPNGASLAFNTSTNQAYGISYDAAGNLTYDGAHSYAYDAEGNMTQVDGGGRATNTYDAENHRVRIDWPGDAYEFLFNLSGQRISVWDPVHSWQIQGQSYWGHAPLEFYSGSQAHFQHQDWLGTERLMTTYNGQTEGSFISLPFGDGASMSGADYDPKHFAGMDRDFTYASNSDHAQFRQYSNSTGRWMSPDPFDGSIDFTNPQSLNRYAYVGNNPLSMTDVSGLMMCQTSPCGGGEGGFFNPPSDGGLSEGGWEGAYSLWDRGPNGAWFALDPDIESRPWGGGGGSGQACIFGWCFSWGGGGQIPGFLGESNQIWSESLGLPTGMQMPIGDPAQTIQQVFGLPTLADINCLPFCDAAPSSGMEYDIFHCPSCVNTWKQSDCVVSKPWEKAGKAVLLGAPAAAITGGVNQTNGWPGFLKGAWNSVREGTVTAGAAAATYATGIFLTAKYTVFGCPND